MWWLGAAFGFVMASALAEFVWGRLLYAVILLIVGVMMFLVSFMRQDMR